MCVWIVSKVLSHISFTFASNAIDEGSQKIIEVRLAGVVGSAHRECMRACAHVSACARACLLLGSKRSQVSLPSPEMPSMAA